MTGSEPAFPAAAFKSLIASFHVELDRIFSAKPTSAKDRRAQLILALKAFGAFVRQQRGPDDAVNRAMLELSTALADLDRGVATPLLTRSNKTGKAADPTMVWLDRAAICLAFVQMMASGMHADAAIRHIRTKHKWAASLVGRRAHGDPSRAIKNWKHQLETDTAPIDAAVASYHSGTKLIDDLNSSGAVSPEERIAHADGMLERRGASRSKYF